MPGSGTEGTEMGHGNIYGHYVGLLNKFSTWLERYNSGEKTNICRNLKNILHNISAYTCFSNKASIFSCDLGHSFFSKSLSFLALAFLAQSLEGELQDSNGGPKVSRDSEDYL